MKTLNVKPIKIWEAKDEDEVPCTWCKPNYKHAHFKRAILSVEYYEDPEFKDAAKVLNSYYSEYDVYQSGAYLKMAILSNRDIGNILENLYRRKYVSFENYQYFYRISKRPLCLNNIINGKLEREIKRGITEILKSFEEEWE